MNDKTITILLDCNMFDFFFDLKINPVNAAKEAGIQNLAFGYTKQILEEIKIVFAKKPEFEEFCSDFMPELNLYGPKRSFGFGKNRSNFAGNFSNGKREAVIRVANKKYAGKEYKHLNDILMMALTAERPNVYDLTMEKSKAIKEVREHKDVNLISFYKYKEILNKDNWLEILIKEIDSLSNSNNQRAK